MTVITVNPDVGLRPLLRFSQQFLNTDTTKPEYVLKENIEKLVRVFTAELQELEEALVDVMYNLAVFDFVDSEGNIVAEKAYGKSLDLLAKIVGAEPRQGMSDEQYRAEIALQIAINTSKGNIIDVVNAIKKITQGTIIEWTDAFPAGISFITNGKYAGSEVLSQITQILSAGVDFSIAYKNEDLGVFEFSDYLLNSTKRFSCSATNGSATVNMSTTVPVIKAGAVVLFEETGGTEFTVLSVSGNVVTLTGNYTGTTNTNTYLTIKDGGITYYPSSDKDKSWGDLYSIFANSVSITDGSDTVTINAADNDKCFAGDYIYFNEESNNAYEVATISGTTITLTTDYVGTTDATATAYVFRKDRDLAGTVGVTNGSTAVTYNDTTDKTKVSIGDTVTFDNTSAYYTVSATSGTGFTLSSNFTGTTNATASCHVITHAGVFIDILS
jgi:hypothetical protein